jgi:hypothetical protein
MPLSRAAIGIRMNAALALTAGALLRVWMLRKFFEARDDAHIYGGLAKALLHGHYGLDAGNGVWQPTLIRLPGYPLFLAGCFKLFGDENYFASCILQIVLDLAACVLLAMFAARIAGPERGRRAALATLWLAACCPFTAIFAVLPLTECLTAVAIALALWCMARFAERPAWGSALGFTFAVAYAALLRPDGALVGVALAPAMALALLRSSEPAGRKLRMAIACVLLALAPFAIWTVRNRRVFHVIQPLAPRYATDPGEETWPGWQNWVKTWCLDYVSTYEVYWNMPKAPLDINDLPRRAFDSAAQRDETARLLADYEANHEELSPALDARFMALANERIAADPFRSLVALPLGRMLDMWFRPRVENLPIDLDWWEYGHHYAETRFSWFYFALNLAFVLLALEGLRRRPRFWGCMLAYFVLRSALLCTIEAPEARYTIECFPMIFVLAGLVLAGYRRASVLPAAPRVSRMA